MFRSARLKFAHPWSLYRGSLCFLGPRPGTRAYHEVYPDLLTLSRSRLRLSQHKTLASHSFLLFPSSSAPAGSCSFLLRLIAPVLRRRSGLLHRLSALLRLRRLRTCLIRAFSAGTMMVDHIVLHQSNQVRGDPIHKQPGGEVKKENGKDHGQYAHHPSLLRVYALCGDLRGCEHGHSRENRQYIVRVVYGEVLEPQQPACRKTLVRAAEVPDDVE